MNDELNGKKGEHWTNPGVGGDSCIWHPEKYAITVLAMQDCKACNLPAGDSDGPTFELVGPRGVRRLFKVPVTGEKKVPAALASFTQHDSWKTKGKSKGTVAIAFGVDEGDPPLEGEGSPVFGEPAHLLSDITDSTVKGSVILPIDVGSQRLLFVSTHATEGIRCKQPGDAEDCRLKAKCYHAGKTPKVARFSNLLLIGGYDKIRAVLDSKVPEDCLSPKGDGKFDCKFDGKAAETQRVAMVMVTRTMLDRYTDRQILWGGDFNSRAQDPLGCPVFTEDFTKLMTPLFSEGEDFLGGQDLDNDNRPFLWTKAMAGWKWAQREHAQLGVGSACPSYQKTVDTNENATTSLNGCGKYSKKKPITYVDRIYYRGAT